MADDCGDGLPTTVKILAGARTGEAMFVIGSNCRIVYWDAGVEFLTGLVGTEVVSKPLYEVLEGETEDRHSSLPPGISGDGVPPARGDG